MQPFLEVAGLGRAAKAPSGHGHLHGHRRLVPRPAPCPAPVIPDLHPEIPFTGFSQPLASVLATRQRERGETGDGDGNWDGVGTCPHTPVHPCTPQSDTCPLGYPCTPESLHPQLAEPVCTYVCPTPREPQASDTGVTGSHGPKAVGCLGTGALG